MTHETSRGLRPTLIGEVEAEHAPDPLEAQIRAAYARGGVTHKQLTKHFAVSMSCVLRALATPVVRERRKPGELSKSERRAVKELFQAGHSIDNLERLYAVPRAVIVQLLFPEDEFTGPTFPLPRRAASALSRSHR